MFTLHDCLLYQWKYRMKEEEEGELHSAIKSKLIDKSKFMSDVRGKESTKASWGIFDLQYSFGLDSVWMSSVE